MPDVHFSKILVPHLFFENPDKLNIKKFACCLRLMSLWPPDAMTLGARGLPSSFTPLRPAACFVWASHQPAPAPPPPPHPVSTRLSTERLRDRMEGELAGTGRPERWSRGDGRRPESRRKDWGWGDDVRSRGGSDGQATADGGQELDSS
jgi:hypothetical protein